MAPHEHPSPDLAIVTDAFLTASRAMIGVSLRSLSASPVEVTLTQHRVLVLLAASGGQTVGALAATLDVNQSNASRLVDRLDRLGLVDRQPSAADGRAVLVTLRPEGRAVLDAVTASRREALAELLENLTLTERRAAARGLMAFNRVAGEPSDSDWKA